MRIWIKGWGCLGNQNLKMKGSPMRSEDMSEKSNLMDDCNMKISRVERRRIASTMIRPNWAWFLRREREIQVFVL
jgi:hypothetical protein